MLIKLTIVAWLVVVVGFIATVIRYVTYDDITKLTIACNNYDAPMYKLLVEVTSWGVIVAVILSVLSIIGVFI